MECLVRFAAFGRQGFVPSTPEGRANFGDALLVLLTGICITWLIPLCVLLAGSSFSGKSLRFTLALRAVRVARLVRVFHRVPAFREGWMLIQGLKDSARTLFWTCAVIGFVTYCYAIVGLVLLVTPLREMEPGLTAPEDIATMDELMHILQGMDRMMYALIQVAYYEFMRNIMYFVGWSWVYFYVYIGFARIVLLNIVTAVIVEQAMANSMKDQEQVFREKEAQMAQLLEDIESLFQFMDADGSGSLSWEEFKASFGSSELRAKWAKLDVMPAECKELFQLLDTGSGEIPLVEFFEGLGQLRGVAQAKDIYKLQKRMVKLQQDVEVALERKPHSSNAR